MTMPGKLYATRLNIDVSDRKLLGEHLNRALASIVDLHSQVKQAHWNIKGPWFFARHELFDKIAANLLAFADDVAERASALGNVAAGTAQHACELSILDGYPDKAVSGQEHLRHLADRYGQVVSMLRESTTVAGKKDPVTEDLLISTLSQLEQDLWFLESHLHD